jgi:hypothetical protein
LKIDPKLLIIFFAFDIVIVVIIVFFMSTNKTYEQGEQIEDHGNLITVNKTEKIDFGSATMDGDYFRVYLKYIVPEGPKLGTQPELFRLLDGDGNLIPIKETSKNWDDLIWENTEPVKDYDGLLYLARLESPESEDIEYRVRLREE